MGEEYFRMLEKDVLYMLTETNEFKAWTVIYALWNMIFIYTKGYSINIAICNNLPALFYAT